MGVKLKLFRWMELYPEQMDITHVLPYPREGPGGYM